MPKWYWCQEHERAEPEGDVCARDKRLGPYESKHDAENWKQVHAQREERWEEQDEEWESAGTDGPGDG